MHICKYAHMHIYARMQVCTTLLKALNKNLFNKSCQGICTYDNNVDHLLWNHLVTKCSFRHNSSFKEKGSLVYPCARLILIWTNLYRLTNAINQSKYVLNVQCTVYSLDNSLKAVTFDNVWKYNSHNPFVLCLTMFDNITHTIHLYYVW